MARYFVSLAGMTVAAIIGLACGGDKPGIAPTTPTRPESLTFGVRCGDPSLPGVLANPAGIVLSIRNPLGEAQAAGAVVNVRNADRAVQSYAGDSLRLSVWVPAGTYSVEISKPFYRDTTISNLVVRQGACAGIVQTTNASVVLQLAPNAPPVRSVGVFGTMFLATPGWQAQMVANVDADPGVSRAVTWRLTDTTMARVDQGGLVTAKCSTHGGADTVIATSIADSAFSGRASFGVGAQASCL